MSLQFQMTQKYGAYKSCFGRVWTSLWNEMPQLVLSLDKCDHLTDQLISSPATSKGCGHSSLLTWHTGLSMESWPDTESMFGEVCDMTMMRRWCFFRVLTKIFWKLNTDISTSGWVSLSSFRIVWNWFKPLFSHLNYNRLVWPHVHQDKLNEFPKHLTLPAIMLEVWWVGSGTCFLDHLGLFLFYSHNLILILYFDEWLKSLKVKPGKLIMIVFSAYIAH